MKNNDENADDWKKLNINDGWIIIVLSKNLKESAAENDNNSIINELKITNNKNNYYKKELINKINEDENDTDENNKKNENDEKNENDKNKNDEDENIKNEKNNGHGPWPET